MTNVKKLLESYERYQSYRQVAREHGVSHNTVKRYVQRAHAAREGKLSEIVPQTRKIQQPGRVVTPDIREKIYRILEKNNKKHKKQQCNAKLIWRHLIKSGYTISYPTVKREVARWHTRLGPREVYISQMVEVGQRAEFDYGKIWVTINGILVKVPMATMVLNNSLYRFALLTPRETLMDIIQAHIAFFHEIDGVPETIFYDNPKTIILDTKTKEWNPTFMAFAIHCGFTPHTCNVRSPHEKGTDEESVRYVRQSVFASRTEFESLEEANQYLKASLAELNGYSVYQRTLTPHEGLVEEQKTLKPLPTLDFSNYFTKTARISKYSIATFETNKYSVPENSPGKTITLKIYSDHLEMVHNDQIIAMHPRLYGKDEYSLNICHYLETFREKPGSLANARAFKHLHASIQRIYHDHYADKPREFLPLLSLLKDYSSVDLVHAIEVLENHQMIPTHDTLRCILNQQPFQMVESAAPLTIDIWVEQPDLKAYDHLMGAS